MGIEHYRRAGEMLLEAKAQVQHGEWMQWVQRNFSLSRTTAATYMKLAERMKLHASVKFETLSEAREPDRGTHQPTWHKPVQAAVNRLSFQSLLYFLLTQNSKLL